MSEQLSHTVVDGGLLSALDAPLDMLGAMPTRLITCLERDQISKIREVTRLTEQQFLRIPGVGRGSLEHMKTLLEAKGLSFTEPDRHGHPPLPFPSMHERLTRIEQRLDRIEAHSLLREVGDMSAHNDAKPWVTNP